MRDSTAQRACAHTVLGTEELTATVWAYSLLTLVTIASRKERLLRARCCAKCSTRADLVKDANSLGREELRSYRFTEQITEAQRGPVTSPVLTASTRQGWDSNPGSLAPEPAPLATTLTASQCPHLGVRGWASERHGASSRGHSGRGQRRSLHAGCGLRGRVCSLPAGSCRC